MVQEGGRDECGGRWQGRIHEGCMRLKVAWFVQ